MLLEEKNAVIYGAGGGIGGGVARTGEPLEAVADDIREVAELDSLDERAVEEHAGSVVSRAAGIGVSFNLISRGDVQGMPLVDMTAANFLTARAAARRMIEQGSGAVLTLTSTSASGGTPLMGSTSPADVATESFMRSLAAEDAHAVRPDLGLWAVGVPETLSPEKIRSVNSTVDLDAAGVEEMLEALAGMRLLRRSPTLEQVADVAAFLASDRAAAMTGTIVNVTGGMVQG